MLRVFCSLFLFFATACSTSVNVEKGSLNSTLTQFQFAMLQQNSTEDAGIIEVAIELSRPVSSPLEIFYQVTGSAVENVNYQLLSPNSVIVPAGSSQISIPIQIIDNSIVEANKYIILTLSPLLGVLNLGLVTTHTIYILENDTAPGVTQILPAPASVLSLPSSLSVTFNKTMNQAQVENIANWNWNCLTGTSAITSVILIENTATLNLNTSIAPNPGSVCTLQLSSLLSDTHGNTLYGQLGTEFEYTLAGAPQVLEVTSSTTNAWYKPGDTINIQVVFSEAVTVSGGIPQITLETGVSDVVVDLISGSGTAALSGSFVVQSNHVANPLNYTSTNALALNGATINSTAFNLVANLTLPGLAASGALAVQKSIQIDGVVPSAPSGLDDGSYLNSTTQSPSLVFTDGVDGLSGLSRHEARVVLASDIAVVLKDWASVVSNQPITDLSLADGQTYAIQLRTIDIAGNSSSVVTTNGWTVDTQNPDAPTALVLGAVPSSLTQSPTLSWTASLDVGASGIAYYQMHLYQGANPIGTWVTKASGGNLTGLTLVDGESYHLKVRAIDHAGNIGAVADSSSWLALAGSDPCLLGNPPIGTVCEDGSHYAGIVNVGSKTYKLAVTPSNCADHPSGGATVGPSSEFTASCSGVGDDTLIKTMNITGNHSLLIGFDSIANVNNRSTVLGDASSQSILAVTPTNPPVAYCDKMNFGGRTDWYLPNKTELTYLYCRSRTSGSATAPQENANCYSYGYGEPGAMLTGFGASFRSYISSSLPDGWWSSGQVLFQNGTLNGQFSWGMEGNAESDYVRCVRRIEMDPCSADTPPPIGTQCLNGTYYMGSLNPGATSGSGISRYMTTPGNCSEIPVAQQAGACPGPSCYPSAHFTPTCSNTQDTLTKTWNDGSANFFDIAGLTNTSSNAGDGLGDTNTDDQYGSTNTSLIAAITNPAQGGYHAAALYCDKLVYAGFDDWHLPNRYELHLIQPNKNLIPGIHVDYGVWYWTSVELANDSAWMGSFINSGQQYSETKDNAHLIRCIRRY